MELRPFRSLRFSPGEIAERGLAALIAPPLDRLPPDVARRLAADGRTVLAMTLESLGEGGEAAAARLADGIARGALLKERRPGLWIYRQSLERGGRTFVAPLLIGLVRLSAGAAEIVRDPEQAPSPTRAERLASRRALRADFEPSLLLTRAPLAGSLATTRRPDLSAADAEGVRHDAFRVIDYAQHVELQGLVKNAEAVLATGRNLWDAAREFQTDPAAAKLPGAKFKISAVIDEAVAEDARRALDDPDWLPAVPSGLFGVSLEDPVY